MNITSDQFKPETLTDAYRAVSDHGGGSILLAPGLYDFSYACANLSKIKGVKLIGSGQGQTVFRSTVPPNLITAGGSAFIFFINGSDIEVTGITSDMSGILTDAANTMAMGFLLCRGVRVYRTDILNGKRLGYGFNSCADWRVYDNFLTRAGAPDGAYQNEAVWASNSDFGVCEDGIVERNIMRGWGTIFSGNNLQVQYNTISHFGYGGGITINDDAGTHNPRIIGNTITDSIGVDCNGAVPSGIECWSPGAIIQLNHCLRNASGGINIGGKFTNASNNTLIDNGQQDGNGCAIVAHAIGSGGVADHSIITNNIMPLGQYQKRGYVEQPGYTYVGQVVANNMTG